MSRRARRPCVEPVGQSVDPVVDVQVVDDALDVHVPGIRACETDVGEQCVVEQERLLGDDHEAMPELGVVDCRERYPAEADLPDDRVGHAGDESTEGGLPRAGGTDHRHLLARRDVDRDAFEHDVVVDGLRRVIDMAVIGRTWQD